jgi:H+/gluconate symporter-like permease
MYSFISGVFLSILIAAVLCFTTEKSNKKEYLKNVLYIFLIGMASTCVMLPIVGPIMGFDSILLNSVIVAGLYKRKSRTKREEV